MSAFIYKLALAFLEYKQNEGCRSDAAGGCTPDASATGSSTQADSDTDRPPAPVGSEAFQQESLATYLKWLRCTRQAGKLGAGFSMHHDLLVLRCEHWLEAADEKHRYGSNLRPYFDFWVNAYNEEEARTEEAASAAAPAAGPAGEQQHGQRRSDVSGADSRDGCTFRGFDTRPAPPDAHAGATELTAAGKQLSLADGLSATIVEDSAEAEASMSASAAAAGAAAAVVGASGAQRPGAPRHTHNVQLSVKVNGVSASGGGIHKSVPSPRAHRAKGLPASPRPSPTASSAQLAVPLTLPGSRRRPAGPDAVAVMPEGPDTPATPAAAAPVPAGGGKGEPAGGWQKVLEVVAATALQRRRGSTSNLRRMARQHGRRAAGASARSHSGCGCGPMLVGSAPVTPATTAHHHIDAATAGSASAQLPPRQSDSHGGHCARPGYTQLCGAGSSSGVGVGGGAGSSDGTPASAGQHPSAASGIDAPPTASMQQQLLLPPQPLHHGWHQYSCPDLRRSVTGGRGAAGESECLSELTADLDERCCAAQRGGATSRCSGTPGTAQPRRIIPSPSAATAPVADPCSARAGTMREQHTDGGDDDRDDLQQRWRRWQLSAASLSRSSSSSDDDDGGGGHGGCNVCGFSDSESEAGRYSGGGASFSWEGSEPPETPPCSEVDAAAPSDLKTLSRLNFFTWLDVGEGKELDLASDGVPRERLESQRVVYLSAEELPHYEVVVEPETGLLRYSVSGDLLHTFAPRGRLSDLAGASSCAQPGREGVGHAADRGPENQPPKGGGGGRSDGDGDCGVASCGDGDAGAGGDSACGKKEAQKWIWVLDPGGRLYVAAKIRGQFHHSSFLRGAAVMAAGNLLAENGRLVKLTADSGHYWPSPGHFKYAYDHLARQGADMSNLAGLEFKTKHQQ